MVTILLKPVPLVLESLDADGQIPVLFIKDLILSLQISVLVNVGLDLSSSGI